ncbi:MAG: single-stranded DNA-binding protein [Flexilinea sp.]
MFHTIIVAGNIGRDPEMRYTPSGVAVTSFSVATSRQYSNAQGQMVKETIWFRISCWSKLAEYANNYLKKGNKVLIEGRLVPDSATGGPRVWTRSDGTTSASYEINAVTIRSLTTRADSEAGTTGTAGSFPEYSEPAVDEDDIPF